MTGVRPATGAILDVDGTLVDSNDAHAHAWVDALTAHGIRASFCDLRPMIGKGGDKILAELAHLADDSPEGEAIDRDRAAAFRTRYVPTIRPIPGVRALLDRFRDAGIRVAVASSASEADLRRLLEIADATELLPHATSSDDAARSKPDPDVVHAALGRLGLPAADVALVGDTPWDVEAATRAGVRTLAVRSGGWPDTALQGAFAIYDDVADVARRFDASPFARRNGAH